MSQWIRADVELGMPMATLTLSLKEAIKQTSWGRIANVLTREQTDPEMIVDAVNCLIGAFRPDLVGGSLIAISLNVMRHQWEFLYVHPLLPRGQAHEFPPSIPLIPDFTIVSDPDGFTLGDAVKVDPSAANPKQYRLSSARTECSKEFGHYQNPMQPGQCYCGEFRMPDHGRIEPDAVVNDG